MVDWIFQATVERLEVVQGEVVAIECLYMVYDVILHLVGAQW